MEVGRLFEGGGPGGELLHVAALDAVEVGPPDGAGGRGPSRPRSAKGIASSAIQPRSVSSRRSRVPETPAAVRRPGAFQSRSTSIERRSRSGLKTRASKTVLR